MNATKERVLATTVLVIGTGGGGLRTAIELKQQGIDVLAVGKRRREDAHTTLAAGGINAALATMDSEDNWQQHAADTIRESYFLADPDVVVTVAKNAARAIQELADWGMPFAREANGHISQRFFGAHKYRRTCFAGDYTGLEIQRTLLRRARNLDVPIIDNIYITRILETDNQVFGAYGFDLDTGEHYLIHADAVVLASGGHTRIWRHTSSRRDENTGDTFRLAILAGGRIRDAELVQFHPSGILEPDDAAGTLISEAARGEGGILRNRLGERFMKRYDPERMELSTRDRVALANYTEIAEGRGTEKGGVILDLTHLPHEKIFERLPRVYRTMIELQRLDITRQPIEIAPTAHYSMGGVWVDAEEHGTGVAGLYAVGEAASGTHGANRLGGNSLTELIVYGRIVGESSARYVRGVERVRRDHAAISLARQEISDLLANTGYESVRNLQRDVRNLMTEHAGVVRNETGLRAGLNQLAQIEARLPEIGVHPDSSGFSDLAHAFDLKGSLVAARATLESALERKETRGAHNRSDYPEQNPAFNVNMVWSIKTGVIQEPVRSISEEISELIGKEDFGIVGPLVE